MTGDAMAGPPRGGVAGRPGPDYFLRHCRAICAAELLGYLAARRSRLRVAALAF